MEGERAVGVGVRLPSRCPKTTVAPDGSLLHPPHPPPHPTQQSHLAIATPPPPAASIRWSAWRALPPPPPACLSPLLHWRHGGEVAWPGRSPIPSPFPSPPLLSRRPLSRRPPCNAFARRRVTAGGAHPGWGGPGPGPGPGPPLFPRSPPAQPIPECTPARPSRSSCSPPPPHPHHARLSPPRPSVTAPAGGHAAQPWDM